jgi:glucosamine-6-phosphate deaminase
MQVQIFDTPDALARAATDRIVAALAAHPAAVLCLPTGHTPLATYAGLVAAGRDGRISFRDCRLLNLDEYVGLGAGDPASFAAYLRERFVGLTDLRPGNVHLLDGAAADPAAEAAAYEALIEWLGGIDLLVCGVGSNGHVAFNEPGADPASRTRVVALAPETLAANAPDLAGARVMPDRAITLGLGTIRAARSILMLATGGEKARPLRALLDGDRAGGYPVAALADHPDLTLLADRAAVPG